MITVRLYGSLAAFGRRFDMQVATAAEALRALMLQLPGLKKQIAAGVFQVRFRGRDLAETDIEGSLTQTADGVLHIVPRVAGAGKKGGIIQTVVGAVLIVVGAMTSWSGGTILIQAGIGLVIGGVAQMLTKTPKMETGKGAEQSRNSSFSNLDNTAAQGSPVPLAYGRVYAGSKVASKGVETRRSGNVIEQMAKAVGADQSGNNVSSDLTAGMRKTFRRGTAALAPNGQRYNTDFDNDSVRARNYTAVYAKTQAV